VLATALGLAVGLAPATPAAAHTRSMSYSTWQLEPDGARVELRIKLLELTRQPPGHPWKRDLPGELTLQIDGDPCPAEEARRTGSAPEGWAIFRWRIHCDASGPRAVSSKLLRGLAASHTHFVRIDAPHAEPGATTEGSRVGIRERVLVTDRDPAWPIDAVSGDAAPSTLASYVWLGALHIASGWDHLTFVVALLLLAASLREVASLVTGFTVGHSLTLGLAVLGLVRPDAVAVEVLIGFSIALVAAENAWLMAGRDRIIPRAVGLALLVAAGVALFGGGALGPLAWLGLCLFSVCHFALLRRTQRPGGLRAAIAFAFGLVHGFGFAGILMELALPTEQLVTALFGFNVGVELGQLTIVVAAWPLLHVLSRARGDLSRWVAEGGSAVIFGLGLFWLVSRNF
jgi:hypothetical protein